jgi:hypothetical protein
VVLKDEQVINKDNWDETRQRLMAFWRGEIMDRCAIAVTVPLDEEKCFAALARYWYNEWRTPEEIRLYWLDAEAIVKRNVLRFENTAYYGEAFPLLNFDLGAVSHAGYFAGARYHFRESLWFEPTILDIEIDALRFDPEQPLYKKTMEFADYFASTAQGRFFVSMPDTAGGIDCLAQLRGSENLLYDLIENRTWVQESVQKILDVWLTTTEIIHRRLKDINDGGSSIGWLSTWAEGRHAQAQCDLSVMISLKDFCELAVPEIKVQAGWMDYSLYHLDGKQQIRHLDTLLRLDEVDCIQWTCVEGQPPPTAFIPELRQIQKAGKRLLILNYDLKVIETLLQELSSAGLYLVTRATCRDEAEAIMRAAIRYTHD